MKTEKQIREEIFGKVSELYLLKKEREKFIAGETPIAYGGRVYDEKEMINSIDASLDFWLTAGRYAGQFEKEFAEFLGIKHCLLTNSGSSANLLAVSALTSPQLKDGRLMPGDGVITTACGFPTTINPIIQNNLTPVFVDIKLGTYNIDEDLVEEAISDRIKAIFISHTLGNPVNLGKILNIAERHHLWFIEDNCDSLGSKYEGKYTGTFSHISTCSFYPAHHITMGEGGAVLTNDPLLKKIILSFRDWGRDCWCKPGYDNTCGKRFEWSLGELPFDYDHKYIYSHIGYNLKITDMQAAIGVAQLKKLPEFIEKRKANFGILYNRFKKYEDYFILPQATKDSDPSWFGFPLLVKEDAPFKRKDIVQYLEKNKVATRMLFGGNLTKQPAYKNIKYRIFGKLKNTDLVMNNLFWVGVYPGITKEKMRYVLEIIDEFFKKGLKMNIKPKVVILCGGKGIRMEKETEYSPKPLIEIGSKPILWHIMKIYAHYGFKDFILCLGYKGGMIKDYFCNYEVVNSDFTVELGTGNIKTHNLFQEKDWVVTLAETGKEAKTGARVKRIEKYITGDLFMLTYGDGVADINIRKLLEFHIKHGKIGTVTGVHPVSRFGEMAIDGDKVITFSEKQQVKKRFISGGFFVFNREFFKYLGNEEDCYLEKYPLEKLAEDGELRVYLHDGFWQCMDTQREMGIRY